MKKWMIPLLSLVLLLLLTACGSQADPARQGRLAVDGETIEPDLWGITLSVKHVESTGLTLVITQDGGEPTGTLEYGSPYRLDVLVDGTWEAVPYAVEGDVAWTMLSYSVKMNGKQTTELDWEWLYGELPAGTYRLVKEFTDFREPGDYDTAEYFVKFEVK